MGVVVVVGIGAVLGLAVVLGVLMLLMRRSRRRRDELSWIAPPDRVAPRPSPADIERRQESSSDSPVQTPLD